MEKEYKIPKPSETEIKVSELVEATLFIGARRANDKLSENVMQELVKQHKCALTKLFMSLLNKEQTDAECDATEAK